MRIMLMSGSPKPVSGASLSILSALKNNLASRAEEGSIIALRSVCEPVVLEEIRDSETVVLAFPLYVDGVPSNMLGAMERLERDKYVCVHTRVYVIVNCGFYEGIQCEPAIKIARNWCRRCGAKWCGAIGFGGGGGFEMMDAVPMGYGPKKSIGRSLEKLADCIVKGEDFGESCLSVDFPSFMYRIGAHSNWSGLAKRNGLKKRDLARKPGKS